MEDGANIMAVNQLTVNASRLADETGPVTLQRIFTTDVQVKMAGLVIKN
jgi:hypothetical protein